MSNISEQMALICKENIKLDGAFNFKAWKKRIDLVLEEHEVLKYVQGKVPKPDDDVKAGFRKGEVKAQRILFESIKDHLIPFVSELASRFIKGSV